MLSGRSRRDHSLWDGEINDQWGGRRPILSPEESLSAARKLYRHATGQAWRGKWALVSGNRFTYPRGGTFYVNPDRVYNSERGLRDIIHLISHYCHRRLHPNDKPHSIRQLRLEARLTKFALERRWHEGTLKATDKPTKAPAPKPDAVALRYRRMISRRDKWKAEAIRATRLLEKAERELRAYERRHRERLAA